MNSIFNLAFKSIKASKSRNILIILTIVFATSLLTSIGILSYSIQQMTIEQIVKQTGRIHVKYKNITNSQLEVLKNNIRIEEIGEAISPDMYVKDDKIGSISLSILYTDNLEMVNMKLKEGKLPVKNNEIALQEWIIKKLGLRPEIGERVNIRCIVRTKENKAFEQDFNFVLCGILEDKDINKDLYISNALVSKNFIEENLSHVNITRNANVRLKGNGDLTIAALEIGRNIGIKDENIKINAAYINALGIDFSLLLPYLLVGIVVILAGAIVIYNIFYISVVYRVNHFGLLSAVGATKKQIRKIISTEALLMAVAGIPLGLILGYMLTYIIIPMFSLEGLLIKSTPYVFIISAVVSLITIAIAVYRPARMASKVSPIEAIRYTGSKSTSLKRKKKVSSKISVSKIAWINLWRNKKRTIMTMMSLILSGTLFIVFSTIISTMNIDNLIANYITGDFQLTSSNVRFDDETDLLNNYLIESIKKIKGVEFVNIIKHDWVYMDENSTNIDLSKISRIKENIKELNCDIYGLDDTLMVQQLEHLVLGSVSLESLRNEDAVLILMKGSNNAIYKPGDKIKIKKYNRDRTYKYVELTVVGCVNKSVAWIGRSGMGPTFIAHYDLFDRIGLDNRIDRVAINIDDEKYEIVENNLIQIAKENDRITYMSHKEIKEERLKELRGIRIASLSLVGIIWIIGMLNLINTMITSIFTRKREIGILQAVGLSDNQLRKMLQIEGLYYSVISAMMSIILGTAIGYIFFQLFKKSATYAQYVFPLSSILLITIGYIVVQVFIILIIGKRIRKDSIIDRIRYIG